MNQPQAILWQCRHFDTLLPHELYAVLAARQHVFILEQRCFYNDFDGLDQEAHHVLGWRHAGLDDGTPPELAAYLRIIAPGVKFPEMSLGRVLTTPAARGAGLGRALLAKGIGFAGQLHPGNRIRIGAQRHLEAFYAGFGFHTVSAPYDEDGIMHIDMLR